MGRPKKDDARIFSYRIRLSKEENTLLERVAKRYGCSKADALRIGLIVLLYLHMTDKKYNILSEILQRYENEEDEEN